MIVFPSFVNFQFNFYVLKRPYYSTVDWKNLLKKIKFFLLNISDSIAINW